VRLGVIPAAMPTVALLTKPFQEKHPNVTIEVRALTSSAIQAKLDDFTLDAGLTYLDNEPPKNVRSRRLYDERYLFVANKESALAGSNCVRWQDAAEEKLCLLTEDMQNRRILNNLTQSLGLSLNPAVTTNSYLAICSHVALGGLSSIVPHTFSIIFAGRDDLILLDLIDPVHQQSIGLIWSDREPSPPLATAFTRCAAHVDIDLAMKAFSFPRK
jgi:DNA-binding transcriptional LysR family regulator